MIEDLRLRVTELERQVANVIRIGSVLAVDHDSALASIQIGENTTAMRPWLTQRAGSDSTWWAPEVGEQVVLFSPSGDFNQGVILPAIYSAAAPAPSTDPDVHREQYADGFVIEHNRATKHTVFNAWDSEGTLELRAKNITLRTGDGGAFLVDHAGYAERITHDGGAAYTTETWHVGATVNADPDHGHNPPEVNE